MKKNKNKNKNAFKDSYTYQIRKMSESHKDIISFVRDHLELTYYKFTLFYFDKSDVKIKYFARFYVNKLQ